jgi:hypothetical protein
MAKTSSIEELGERIERLVQEHITSSRRAAQRAVERAFASAGGAPPVRRRAQTRASGPGGGRRTPAELTELAERFYQAVSEKPGETMSVLMADVGASARELNRPVALLKRAGRVRTVGARNHTRYFPMGEVSASA